MGGIETYDDMERVRLVVSFVGEDGRRHEQGEMGKIFPITRTLTECRQENQYEVNLDDDEHGRGGGLITLPSTYFERAADIRKPGELRQGDRVSLKVARTGRDGTLEQGHMGTVIATRTTVAGVFHDVALDYAENITIPVDELRHHAGFYAKVTYSAEEGVRVSWAEGRHGPLISWSDEDSAEEVGPDKEPAQNELPLHELDRVRLTGPLDLSQKAIPAGATGIIPDGARLREFLDAASEQLVVLDSGELVIVPDNLLARQPEEGAPSARAAVGVPDAPVRRGPLAFDLVRDLCYVDDYYVGAVAISADGNYVGVALGCFGVPMTGEFRVLDLRDGALVRSLVEPSGWGGSITFSPDGRYILTGAQSSAINLWELSSGALVARLSEAVPGQEFGQCIGLFTPDGNVVTSVSRSTLQAWRMIDLQAQRRFSGDEQICHADYLADGGLLATASVSEPVRIWDARTGQRLRELPSGSDKIAHVQFSPTSPILATASIENPTVRFWDAISGEPLSPELRDHAAAISCIAFTPDGRYLASGSHDKTVRFWEVESMRSAGVLSVGKEVSGVAFAPDGTFVVAHRHLSTYRYR